MKREEALEDALRGLRRFSDHLPTCGDDSEPGDVSCDCGYYAAMQDVDAALALNARPSAPPVTGEGELPTWPPQAGDVWRIEPRDVTLTAHYEDEWTTAEGDEFTDEAFTDGTLTPVRRGTPKDKTEGGR